MWLHSLRLQNVGAYYGSHKIEFDHPFKDRNLILIGGKNGAGKTTLLESLRLALFGPLAFGFRTETEGYREKIRSLFNRKAREEGKMHFKVAVMISQIEDFEKNVYEIERDWEWKNDRFKEVVTVLKNGRPLSPVQAENFQNKIREEIPPRLFELTIFDGEEISRIVSEGRLSAYLQEISSVLFNLDLFEKMEGDLVNYHEYLSLKNELTDFDKKLKYIQDNLYELRAVYNNRQDHLKELADNLRNKEELLHLIREEFTKHGGINQDQREKLVLQEKSLKQRRGHNLERIKKFISTDLPFYLNRPLIHQILKQMEKEKELEVIGYFIRMSDSPDWKEKLNTKLALSGVQIEEFLTQFTDLLQESIGINEQNVIHRASSVQYNEVNYLYHRIKKIKADDYLDLYDENQQLLKEVQQIRKQIELNDEALDLRKYVLQMEETTKQIEQIRLQMIELEEEIKQLGEKINVLEKEKEKLLQKRYDVERSESILGFSNKIIEISKRFREIQLKKKLKQVEIEVQKMIQFVFRKKQFIQIVKINPETFDVMLFDHLSEVKKERLSAGEKELLMLCLVWAMFYVSGRNFPFVFDTLLGRLDQEHRILMMTELLSKMGKQVIILSTDTEIDQGLYEKIRPHIAKVFTLEYDPFQNQSFIQPNQYFSLSKMGMTI
ncbi:DNA sulfur modification protein DndD [Thermoactinomyces sp. CICC 10521]|uniref:DNA sulfur modification protein DndD n=1 Tax=Thermoactinomyces sp. CICC 10521 TaxID=2767426 RepID=UPI0018DC6DD8|nr:DNA sulfur modification protein DndD [Thermoactinomyces sp. CICC 10521]MBH8608231.1 DNA sulfur modification protein DndD [Thermoactinomyces sp. CICC 10521]